MNEKDEIKNAIENIRPDAYMKTRIKANIKTPEKAKTPVWRKAGATVLALAILCGAGGIYANNNADEKITKHSAVFSESIVPDFSIVAYAQEKDSKKITDKITLDEKSVNLADTKIIVYKDENNSGDYAIETSATQYFEVKSKNIEDVTFKSESGEFYCLDEQLIEYAEKNGTYYSAVISLSEEESRDYYENYEPDGKSFAEKILNSRDCCKYFKNEKILPLEEYFVYFDDMKTLGDGNYLVFKEKSEYEKYYKMSNEVTLKTYTDDTQIKNVSYLPNGATDCLLENPDMKASEIPKDTITITVRYKDGSAASKSYEVSFNDDRNIQYTFIK